MGGPLESFLLQWKKGLEGKVTAFFFASTSVAMFDGRRYDVGLSKLIVPQNPWLGHESTHKEIQTQVTFAHVFFPGWQF